MLWLAMGANVFHPWSGPPWEAVVHFMMLSQGICLVTIATYVTAHTPVTLAVSSAIAVAAVPSVTTSGWQVVNFEDVCNGRRYRQKKGEAKDPPIAQL